MAAIAVRNSVIQRVQNTRHTGLIFRTFNGAGALVDSNAQVPVADLSTKLLGHAAPLLPAQTMSQPYAVNDRQDNTGV